MKKQILILAFALISAMTFAQTTLTQAQYDTLLSSSEFRQYLTDNVATQAAYLLGLSSFDQTTAMAYSYSKLIRSNPDLVSGDNNLNNFALIQMVIRGLNKGDDAVHSSVFKKVRSYLNTSGRIGFIVTDYFADKTKGY